MITYKVWVAIEQHDSKTDEYAEVGLPVELVCTNSLEEAEATVDGVTEYLASKRSFSMGLLIRAATTLLENADERDEASDKDGPYSDWEEVRLALNALRAVGPPSKPAK